MKKWLLGLNKHISLFNHLGFRSKRLRKALHVYLKTVVWNKMKQKKRKRMFNLPYFALSHGMKIYKKQKIIVDRSLSYISKQQQAINATCLFEHF